MSLHVLIIEIDKWKAIKDNYSFNCLQGTMGYLIKCPEEFLHLQGVR
jgi:hypothetical protein